MKKEEKKSENSQEDSSFKSYMEEIFYFLPLSLCIIDLNGVIKETNYAFLKMTGYKKEEIIGEGVSFFLAGEEIEPFLDAAKEQGSVEKDKLRISNKEGETIPVKIFMRSCSCSSEKGEECFFVSFFDMWEVETKEKELQRTRRKMKEKMREMGKINRLTVGRELKMVELKEKIKDLEEEIEKYKKEKEGQKEKKES